MLGGGGDVAPMPRIEEVDDLDGGPSYPIITGDYRSPRAWGRHPLTVGTPVAKPTPVFTKLDPGVVDEELARLAGEASGVRRLALERCVAGAVSRRSLERAASPHDRLRAVAPPVRLAPPGLAALDRWDWVFR